MSEVTENIENTPETPAEDSSKMDELVTALGETMFPNSEVHKESEDEPSEGDSDDKSSEEEPDIKDKDAETKSEDTPPDAKVEPPRTWRADALQVWDQIPKQAQDEILKREQDIFAGIEAYKAAAGVGERVRQVFEPYKEILTSQQVDPLVLTNNLLNAHVTLSTGDRAAKETMFINLARAYGIEIPGVDEGYVDPTVAELQSKIHELQSRQDSMQQMTEIAQKAEINKEIDAFVAQPGHEDFDELASDIAMMLRAGAKTLQEAYDKAKALNPAVQAKERARIAAEAVSKAKAAETERVAKAKKASSANVSTGGKLGNGKTPIGSIDDTLASTFRELKAKGKAA